MKGEGKRENSEMSFEIAPKRPRVEESPFVAEQHAVLIKNFFSVDDVKKLLSEHLRLKIENIRKGNPEDEIFYKTFEAKINGADGKTDEIRLENDHTFLLGRDKAQNFHYDYEIETNWIKSVIIDKHSREIDKRLTFVIALVDDVTPTMYAKRSTDFAAEGFNATGENALEDGSKPLLECQEDAKIITLAPMQAGDALVHQDDFACHAGPARPQNKPVFIGGVTIDKSRSFEDFIVAISDGKEVVGVM